MAAASHKSKWISCRVAIEAAMNLAGWAPVLTNTTPINVLFFTDPDASSLSTRFYRTFQFP